MKTLNTVDWACAVAMVFIAIFVKRKVDAITFSWLGLFLASVYGVPFYYGPLLARMRYKYERLYEEEE